MLPVRPREEEEARADEPQEIRNLTKKALHAKLNGDFYIPECTSRGVNRAYLVGVFTGTNYRIPLIEYKRFEAELTPAMKKRVPLLCLQESATKLTMLLEEMRQPPFGFPRGVYPEEAWFFDVARFVDRSNICGFFMSGLPAVIAPECLTARMVAAKKAAEVFLMGERELLTKPLIYNKVKEVWESQKRLTAKRVEIVALVAHGRDLEEKASNEESSLNTKLMEAALAIFACGNGMDNPDQIFHEQNGNAHRLQLNQISTMYVCTDPGSSSSTWLIQCSIEKPGQSTTATGLHLQTTNPTTTTTLKADSTPDRGVSELSTFIFTFSCLNIQPFKIS
jgi:hypothetical protein